MDRTSCEGPCYGQGLLAIHTQSKLATKGHPSDKPLQRDWLGNKQALDLPMSTSPMQPVYTMLLWIHARSLAPSRDYYTLIFKIRPKSAFDLYRLCILKWGTSISFYTMNISFADTSPIPHDKAYSKVITVFDHKGVVLKSGNINILHLY